MKINDIPALSEEVVNDQYVMIFPQDTFIDPPFRVTTDEGAEIHVVDGYPAFERKEVIKSGLTKYVYGKADPVGERIAQIEKLIAEIEGGGGEIPHGDLEFLRGLRAGLMGVSV